VLSVAGFFAVMGLFLGSGGFILAGKKGPERRREASSLQETVQKCTHARCRVVYQPGYVPSRCTGRQGGPYLGVQGGIYREERVGGIYLAQQ